MNVPYSEFVTTLTKPGEAILAEMNPDQMHLLHMAVGVAGEGGELLDAIKKVAIYQREIDVENVIEELGDLCFYMQGIMNALGLTWVQVLDHNQQKLAKRYEGLRYSNGAAQARADKGEAA